jgi:hypothetical protein
VKRLSESCGGLLILLGALGLVRELVGRTPFLGVVWRLAEKVELLRENGILVSVALAGAGFGLVMIGGGRRR